MAERISARTVSIASGSTETMVITNSPAPAQPGAPLPPGATDAIGRYRLLRKLGEGGMGVVYLAEDPAAGRQVALKIPSASLNAEVNAIKRLHREAQAGCAINHPNVCQVYEVGEHAGRNYLAMQYIAGCTLGEWIQRNPDLDAEHAVAMIAKIARGVDAAHQAGILHRDLKPGNVMIDASGEPIVTDFGMARWMEAQHTLITVSGSLIGTPGYMAPEQIMGETDQIGPATDVYSLGVMLYELLTGWQPFSGNMATLLGSIVSDPPPPMATYVPGVPPQLEAICLRALAKSPAERYPAAGELAAALESYREAAPAPPPAAEPAPPPAGPPPAEAAPAGLEPPGRFRRLLHGLFTKKES